MVDGHFNELKFLPFPRRRKAEEEKDKTGVPVPPLETENGGSGLVSVATEAGPEGIHPEAS